MFCRKDIAEDVEGPPIPFKRSDFSSLHHTGASLRASTRGELSSNLLHRSSVRSGKSIKSAQSAISDDSGHDSSNPQSQIGFTRGGRASLRASTKGEMRSSLLQRSVSIRKSMKSEDKCTDHPISYHSHNIPHTISPLANDTHAPTSTIVKPSGLVSDKHIESGAKTISDLVK